jgi:hypothetical protein
MFSARIIGVGCRALVFHLEPDANLQTCGWALDGKRGPVARWVLRLELHAAVEAASVGKVSGRPEGHASGLTPV